MIPRRINEELDPNNFVDRLVQAVEPFGKKIEASNISVQPFTEGITNTIVGIFNKDRSNPREALVLKFFGDNTELFIDREKEIQRMIELHEHGVIRQRVLVQFNNSVVYEFAPGRPCSRDDLRNESLSNLIAVQLARLHSVPLGQSETTVQFVRLIRTFLNILDQHEKHSVDQYRSDMDLIERFVLNDLVPDGRPGRDIVLCHNDLLVKNIIYDETLNEISIIDFEYTDVNYALFDIANHFVEYAGVDDADFSIYPTREEQKRFLTVYFRQRGINDICIDEKLCHTVDRFSAVAHLMWGLWALVQSIYSKIDFDYVLYSKLRFDRYQSLRSILFENLRD